MAFPLSIPAFLWLIWYTLYIKRTKGLVDMKKIIVSNIEWDTDGEDVGLPREAVVENPTDEMISEAMDGGFCDSIADWLSDKYGFCVGGFAVDIEE